MSKADITQDVAAKEGLDIPVFLAEDVRDILVAALENDWDSFWERYYEWGDYSFGAALKFARTQRRAYRALGLRPLRTKDR